MDGFFQAILAFPTVVFSLPLAVLVAYWMFVIMGVLDLDFLDFDGLLEGGADAALDGAGVAAIEATDGALEGTEANSESSGGGLLQILGLAGVPVTISLSILTFAGWIASYLGMQSLAKGNAAAWIPAVVGLGALSLGLVTASTAARPLRKLLTTHQAPQRKAFVGQLCTVTTLRVDREFGQAEIDDGGAGLLVPVRCLDVNELTRGSKALIFRYDSHLEVYLVTPVAEALT